VIKIAMIRIHNRLRAEGRAARLVLQVHDELLLEVPEIEVSSVRELVRAEMVGAYPLDPLLAGTPLNAFPYWGAAGTPVPRLDAVLPPPQAATRATASAPMNNPARVFSLIAVVCTPLSRLWALIDGVDARRQTRVTSCRES